MYGGPLKNCIRPCYGLRVPGLPRRDAHGRSDRPKCKYASSGGISAALGVLQGTSDRRGDRSSRARRWRVGAGSARRRRSPRAVHAPVAAHRGVYRARRGADRGRRGAARRTCLDRQDRRPPSRDVRRRARARGRGSRPGLDRRNPARPPAEPRRDLAVDPDRRPRGRCAVRCRDRRRVWRRGAREDHRRDGARDQAPDRCAAQPARSGRPAEARRRGSPAHDAGARRHLRTGRAASRGQGREAVVAVRTARQESTTLAIALLASLLVWNLPLGGYVLYPFKLLATWMHELSHGIAMTACGAGFDHILVYRDTSGLAYARSSVGGFGSAVIAGAGYMGTPVWGAVLLVLTHDARTARRALAVLAGLLIVTAMFVIAPTPTEGEFGPYAVGAIGGVVLVCALGLPARWRLFGAHFLAAQACCNALLDIRVLLRSCR